MFIDCLSAADVVAEFFYSHTSQRAVLNYASCHTTREPEAPAAVFERLEELVEGLGKARATAALLLRFFSHLGARINRLRSRVLLLPLADRRRVGREGPGFFRRRCRSEVLSATRLARTAIWVP